MDSLLEESKSLETLVLLMNRRDAIAQAVEQPAFQTIEERHFGSDALTEFQLEIISLWKDIFTRPRGDGDAGKHLETLVIKPMLLVDHLATE